MINIINSVDTHYAEVQNQPHPPSSYQQCSYMDASAHRLSGHSQEAAPLSLESSYASNGHSYEEGGQDPDHLLRVKDE
ncbi:unnamed protein product [Lupinus luteus]|uniref:Uncharacterized protein n=1 Tax=Lupinus luteus TaxID=3873 RepID=A0AAV1WUR9_LUPLU